MQLPTHKTVSGSWGYGDIFFLDWPPCSPDCSLIQNVWQTINDRIQKRNPFPTTNESLHQAIQEEWDAISPEELESLVESVPTRLHEV